MISKTILILLSIIIISVPLTVNAVVESWIEYDCDKLKAGMIPICNDINILSDRLTNVENLHVQIKDPRTMNASSIAGIPFLIEGFTATVNYTIDWTDKIMIKINAPNGTEIQQGPQPTTFIPDRNGDWMIGILAGDVGQHKVVEVTGGYIPIIDVTLSILYTDNGDYLQVNATGFYPNDLVEYIGSGVRGGGYLIADSKGEIYLQYTSDLNIISSPGNTIVVKVTDRSTPAIGSASIIYNPK